MALTGEYVPSSSQWVRDQVAEFEASDGQRANTLPDRPEWPIVVITSVGHRSGKLRKNPVMRVEHDGAYAAIASKGGHPEHPEWFHNFIAHPEVDLQDGAEKHTYRARLVDPNISAGIESLEVGLFDYADIPWSDLAFPSVRWALTQYAEIKDRVSFPAFSNPPGESGDHGT